ncbi:hypothetical protein BU54_28065 [Escherichia coli O45:H2 str. 2010C-4211]|nr:hypothetical protein BU54_28065 [Escherichia coli O45:H2 str. 2010C-4211]
MLRQRRVTQGTAGKGICLFVFIHTFRPADCLRRKGPRLVIGQYRLCAFKRQYQYANCTTGFLSVPDHQFPAGFIQHQGRQCRCCRGNPAAACGGMSRIITGKNTYFRTLFSDGFRYHIVKTSC